MYADVVFETLESGAREALEGMLTAKKHEFKSEFARKYLAEGRAIAKAEAIVAVLEARGLTISGEQRARIQGCRDIGTLDSWIARAATANSICELFEPGDEGPAPA